MNSHISMVHYLFSSLKIAVGSGLSSQPYEIAFRNFAFYGLLLWFLFPNLTWIINFGHVQSQKLLLIQNSLLIQLDLRLYQYKTFLIVLLYASCNFNPWKALETEAH